MYAIQYNINNDNVIAETKGFLKQMTFNEHRGDSRLGRTVAVDLNPYWKQQQLSLIVRCHQRIRNIIDWSNLVFVIEGKKEHISYLIRIDRHGIAHLTNIIPQDYRILVPQTWCKNVQDTVTTSVAKSHKAAILAPEKLHSHTKSNITPTEESPAKTERVTLAACTIAKADIYELKTGLQWEEIDSFDERISITLEPLSDDKVSIYLITSDSTLNGATAVFYFIKPDDSNCKTLHSGPFKITPISNRSNSYGVEWTGQIALKWPYTIYFCVYQDDNKKKSN